MGEEAVRDYVASRRFSDERKAWAVDWLARKEAARKDIAQSEQTEMARNAAAEALRAADAAERAATAAEAQAAASAAQAEAANSQAQEARRANNRATAALVIAIVTALIMIIGIVAV
jgi:ferric-dicitrate binding protein FerR (iron transport regulator)